MEYKINLQQIRDGYNNLYNDLSVLRLLDKHWGEFQKKAIYQLQEQREKFNPFAEWISVPNDTKQMGTSTAYEMPMPTIYKDYNHPAAGFWQIDVVKNIREATAWGQEVAVMAMLAYTGTMVLEITTIPIFVIKMETLIGDEIRLFYVNKSKKEPLTPFVLKPLPIDFMRILPRLSDPDHIFANAWSIKLENL